MQNKTKTKRKSKIMARLRLLALPHTWINWNLAIVYFCHELWIIFPRVIFKTCISQLKEIYPTFTIAIGVKTEPRRLQPTLSKSSTPTPLHWNKFEMTRCTGSYEIHSLWALGSTKRRAMTLKFLFRCLHDVIFSYSFNGVYSCGTWLSRVLVKVDSRRIAIPYKSRKKKVIPPS